MQGAQIEYCCGSILEGNFRNSRREGLCTLRLACKDYLKAEYKNGLAHGMGFAQFHNYGNFSRISYEGEFQQGQKFGYGEMLVSGLAQSPRGTDIEGGDAFAVFNGEWRNDLQYYGSFSGFGHKYMGFWRGRLMDKEGVYRTPEGKVYRGEIREGRFVGRGEFIDQAQIVKGDFQDNGDLNERGMISSNRPDYHFRDGIRRSGQGWPTSWSWKEDLA